MNCYNLASIFSFFVAFVGLIYLIRYAGDTKEIRIATQKQLEAPFIPCVLFVEEIGNDSVDALMWMKNAGPGTAINIRWRFEGKKDNHWIEAPALGVGESRQTSLLKSNVLNRGSLECEFESLGGKRYRSRSGFHKDSQHLDLRHQFKQL